MKNKVIIIGGDHSNALGVIRSFGENGIKPYVFIISETKFVAIKKSKYIEKYYICKDEEEAILKLIVEFNNEKYKPVIIPTSDRASAILDSNYNRLKDNFILHNINNEEKKIIYYMDKYNQYLLAKDNNINVANSMILKIPFEEEISINYPMIIKPLSSFKGRKEDICIVKNPTELKSKLEQLKEKKYQELLLQEIIEFDYECDMSGYCFHKQVSVVGFVKKERIWPEKRGSLTFGEVKNLDKFREKIKTITDLLIKINYTGLFDIEFFIKDNDIYLNEINFRNSGLTYLYGESYICFNYYKSCIQNEFCPSPEIKENYYVMDEQAELHQIIDRKVSLKKHTNDKRKSKILLVSKKDDNRPSRYLLFYKILNNLKIKKILLIFEKAFHKCPDSLLLTIKRKDIKKQLYNDDYEVIEITKDNVYTISNFNKEIQRNIEEGLAKGIIIKKNNDIIGSGLLKCKSAKDRFVKLINPTSYLISNIYVNSKFRGNKYQCDIVNELIERYVKEDNANIYTVVYKYNIPSWKNFETIGFNSIKEKQIIRVLKMSINKYKV